MAGVNDGIRLRIESKALKILEKKIDKEENWAVALGCVAKVLSDFKISSPRCPSCSCTSSKNQQT